MHTGPTSEEEQRMLEANRRRRQAEEREQKRREEAERKAANEAKAQQDQERQKKLELVSCRVVLLARKLESSQQVQELVYECRNWYHYSLLYYSTICIWYIANATF